MVAANVSKPISSVKIEATSIIASQNPAQDLYQHNTLHSPRKIVRATHSFDLRQSLAYQNSLLTLHEGDLILVHATHSGGWIDGTLLATGSRGWLHGNFYEIYKPEKLSFLLSTLLCFQNLRSRGLVKASDCREFIGAIAAGVRLLLESINCLHRKSPVVRKRGLEERRKALLSRFYSLAQMIHYLQRTDTCTSHAHDTRIFDEVFLRACRVVDTSAALLEKDNSVMASTDSLPQQVSLDPYNAHTKTMRERSRRLTQPLNQNYDAFLSSLGILIGLLQLRHLQHAEFAIAIQRTVASGNKLMETINGLCRYRSLGSDRLFKSRLELSDCFQSLVYAIREAPDTTPTELGRATFQDHARRLLKAAIGCVRAAGSYVYQANSAMEQVRLAAVQAGEDSWTIQPDNTGIKTVGSPEFTATKSITLAESTAGEPLHSPMYLSHTPKTQVMPLTSKFNILPDPSGPSDQTSSRESLQSSQTTFAHELAVNAGGRVTGGTLSALVEHLTTPEPCPDPLFASTFYLTFRSFCSPTEFARALIDRFRCTSADARTSQIVRSKVYTVLQHWLKSRWNRQADQAALQLILPFVRRRMTVVMPSSSRQLLRHIETAIRGPDSGSPSKPSVEKTEEHGNSGVKLSPAEATLQLLNLLRGRTLFWNAFYRGDKPSTVLDFEPRELARQLAIRQMEIFCRIQTDELLDSQWMKDDGSGSPNVIAVLTYSSNISRLVTGTILEHSAFKKRGSVIVHWIDVAHHCLELHNYEGLAAVVCGLSSTAIRRLHKTQDTVPEIHRENLERLQMITDPSRNYKVLRTKMRNHVPPCLPFLGMHLKDLTFVDAGNPATKQMLPSCGGLDRGRTGIITIINFEKHSRTANILRELQRFQNPHRLRTLAIIQDWLSYQLRLVSEADLGGKRLSYYSRSLLLEPRASLSGSSKL